MPCEHGSHRTPYRVRHSGLQACRDRFEPMPTKDTGASRHRLRALPMTGPQSKASSRSVGGPQGAKPAVTVPSSPESPALVVRSRFCGRPPSAGGDTKGRRFSSSTRPPRASVSPCRATVWALHSSRTSLRRTRDACIS
jgi:hypothetical protein